MNHVFMKGRSAAAPELVQLLANVNQKLQEYYDKGYSFGGEGAEDKEEGATKEKEEDQNGGGESDLKSMLKTLHKLKLEVETLCDKEPMH